MKTKKIPKVHGRRYPWDEWIAQQTVRLKRGKHFDCREWVMAQIVRNRVRELKMGSEISIGEGVITVTFTPTPKRSKKCPPLNGR